MGIASPETNALYGRHIDFDQPIPQYRQANPGPVRIVTVQESTAGTDSEAYWEGIVRSAGRFRNRPILTQAQRLAGAMPPPAGASRGRNRL